MKQPNPITIHIFKNGAFVRKQTFSQPEIKIGHLKSAHLHFDDIDVSGMHAVIQTGPNGVEITDLGSRHGTFVNGLRVHKSELISDDRIKIGDNEMTIVIPELLTDLGRVKPNKEQAKKLRADIDKTADHSQTVFLDHYLQSICEDFTGWKLGAPCQLIDTTLKTYRAYGVVIRPSKKRVFLSYHLALPGNFTDGFWNAGPARLARVKLDDSNRKNFGTVVDVCDIVQTLNASIAVRDFNPDTLAKILAPVLRREVTSIGTWADALPVHLPLSFERGDVYRILSDSEKTLISVPGTYYGDA